MCAYACIRVDHIVPVSELAAEVLRVCDAKGRDWYCIEQPAAPLCDEDCSGEQLLEYEQAEWDWSFDCWSSIY